MQAPTHILAGVIIKKLFEWRRFKPVAFVIIAVLAFLSHGLLDALARITYHRPDADLGNPVWVGYHLVVLLTTIVFLYMWWGGYKWAIVFALLPDIDWVFIHVQELFRVTIPFYTTPHIHNLLHLIYDNVPPFSYISQLPDNRYNPLAAFGEVLLIIGMLFTIRALDNRRRNIHF